MRFLGESRLGAEPAAKRTIDGRLVLLGAVALYFAIVAIPRLLWSFDVWPGLGVPSGPTLFYDARNVAAAADCQRLGYDPLVNNPCDPTNRVLVYPRVWLLLGHLGLEQSQTPLFGTLVVGLFLASLLLFLGRLTLGQGVVAAIAVSSPAVMLAVERGNMDLVLFAVFVAAVLLWRTRPQIAVMVSPVMIVLAAVAKLYAVFALPVFAFTRERRIRWVVVACVAIPLLYIVFSLDDIKAIASAPEGGLLFSYGIRILPGWLYHLVVPDAWQGQWLVAQGLVVVPVLVAAVIVWLRLRRRFSPLLLSSLQRQSGSLLAFHFGVFVYLGTFLTRKNGDYRLVFLLLTLPQLFAWVADDSDDRRDFARATLAAVLVCLWVGALSRHVAPADELGSWAVAGLFIAMLAGSVPRLSLGRWEERWPAAPGGSFGGDLPRSQDSHEARPAGAPSIGNAIPPLRHRPKGVRAEPDDGV
jgi:hypothetical protein